MADCYIIRNGVGSSSESAELGDLSKFFVGQNQNLADLIEFWIDRGDLSDPRALIPKLESNTGVNGIASSNNDVNYNGASNDPSKAYYAFDGNNSTNVQYYTEGQSGGWIQYEFDTLVTVGKMTAKVGGYYTSNNFTFVFQYYDDTSNTWKNYGNEQTVTGYASGSFGNYIVKDEIITTSKVRMKSDTVKNSGTNWIVYELQVYSS